MILLQCFSDFLGALLIFALQYLTSRAIRPAQGKSALQKSIDLPKQSPTSNSSLSEKLFEHLEQMHWKANIAFGDATGSRSNPAHTSYTRSTSTSPSAMLATLVFTGLSG
jgi:hypothetical protein